MQDAPPSQSLEALCKRASVLFGEYCGGQPRWIVAAPGRVNLIGEHVDYNDGFVLPMAIDRYCVIAAADYGRDVARLWNVDTKDGTAIPIASLRPGPEKPHWSNYLVGVITEFFERNVRPPGFRGVILSNVPLGGGLSSSASLEVATATLLEAMSGTTLELREKALLCQKAEHDFAGVPCGIMDQFTSVMGRADHLMLLDCRSQTVDHVPFLDPALTVLIVNTNVKHELAGGEYADRRAQCESAARKLGVASLRDAGFPQLHVRRRHLSSVEYLRAKHAITEIARTVKAAAAVKAGEWAEVGRLMYASHDSLRDDYDVSCRELDLLVDLAREIGPDGGVLGSRMTGGGFGGCTVSLVETAKVKVVNGELLDRYRDATGIEASALTSRPARGAHVVVNQKDEIE
jgi:galactokinase